MIFDNRKIYKLPITCIIIKANKDTLKIKKMENKNQNDVNATESIGVTEMPLIKFCIYTAYKRTLCDIEEELFARKIVELNLSKVARSTQ